MKSRWVTNLFLVFAIGILSLIAHFEPGIEKPAAEIYLTSLTQDAVTRIQLDRSLLPKLVLVKKDNAWFIEQDPPLPANKFQVNALTRLAVQTVKRRYAPTELDLAQVGLSSPENRVTLNQQELIFGGIDPLEALRYVKAGNTVHLIEDLYQNQIQSSFTNFVRHRLFAESDKITALKLPGFQMQQVEGKWQLTPEQTVSTDKLHLFIEGWQAASALNVQKMDPETTGETIYVTLSGQEEAVKFIIQASESQLILARPDYGIQYKLGDRSGDFIEIPTDTDDGNLEQVEIKTE